MRVGRLRAQLFLKGISVSTPDAHVAQCALDVNADLLSEDHVFSAIAKDRAPIADLTCPRPLQAGRVAFFSSCVGTGFGWFRLAGD